MKVNAWSSTEEWDQVKKWVHSDNVLELQKAHDTILAWRSRVNRLPAGVETTLCLLQALLSAGSGNPSSVVLTVSAAINRFLNLVTHSGLNMLGLSKYHDVAKVFKIPGWIVDVRHETNHGYMPCKQVMLSALAFAIRWIRLNYWASDEKGCANREDLDSRQYYVNIHNLLDCYRYLKIYLIWGNQHVGELKDQAELYDHICQAWEAGNGVKKRKTENIDQVRIKDGVNLIRNQIHSVVSGLGDSADKVEALMANLVEDEMLIPDEDFLNSLQEEDDIKGQLPKNLVKSWSDILKLLAEQRLLPTLLKALLTRICRSSRDKRKQKIASSWIMDILRSLTSQKAKHQGKSRLLDLEKQGPSESWNDFVKVALETPDEYLLTMLPHLSLIMSPPMTKSQESEITQLIQLAIGKESRIKAGEEVLEIKTFQNLPIQRPSIKSWTKADHVDWSKIPLGLCPGQSCMKTWQHLDFSDIRPGWSTSGQTDCMDFLHNYDHDQVEQVDWDALTSDQYGEQFQSGSKTPPQSNVPAFYRNSYSVPAKGKRKWSR